MAKRGDRDHQRKRPAPWDYAFALLSKVLPYAFWFCLVFFGLPRLAPLLKLVAGRETIFQFDFVVSVSVVLNVVLGGLLARQVRAGKAAADRVTELESERPSLRPPGEQLPLEGDERDGA